MRKCREGEKEKALAAPAILLAGLEMYFCESTTRELEPFHGGLQWIHQPRAARTIQAEMSLTNTSPARRNMYFLYLFFLNHISMDLLNQLYAFLGFVTTMWQMENIGITFFFPSRTHECEAVWTPCKTAIPAKNKSNNEIKFEHNCWRNNSADFIFFWKFWVSLRTNVPRRHRRRHVDSLGKFLELEIDHAVWFIALTHSGETKSLLMSCRFIGTHVFPARLCSSVQMAFFRSQIKNHRQ